MNMAVDTRVTNYLEQKVIVIAIGKPLNCFDFNQEVGWIVLALQMESV